MFKFLPLMSLMLALGCATTKPKEDPFVISRTFDSDIKSVYKMWIKPEFFSKWLGPTGANMSFMKSDVKEGGTSQWKMTTPDGMTKYGQLNYKKISPSDLLIYTQNFCDKDGKFAKLPISAPYPDRLLTTVTLKSEGEKKTQVTVKWEVFGEATQAERQTFQSMKPIMTTGWGQSFDKLESLLK